MLHQINLNIPANKVTAIIGPSGCGKSTLLRSINRMNDFLEDVRVEGEIIFDGSNIYDESVDPVVVIRRIGMVFQVPNPFPKSIFENVAYGLRIQGWKDKKAIEEQVVKSLQAAALWDEVKDRLHSSASDLASATTSLYCSSYSSGARNLAYG